MELGRQIKKYRNELSMSQDTLAERVFVSRQTISNWENDKSYPDVNSLVLLSEVFHTSIDNLIKGDIEIMKQEVRSEDKKQFERLSQAFAVMLLTMMITPIPLAHFLSYIGIAVWVIFAVATLYVALLVEKKKKKSSLTSRHTRKSLHLRRVKVWTRSQRRGRKANDHTRSCCLRLQPERSHLLSRSHLPCY